MMKDIGRLKAFLDSIGLEYENSEVSHGEGKRVRVIIPNSLKDGETVFEFDEQGTFIQHWAAKE